MPNAFGQMAIDNVWHMPNDRGMERDAPLSEIAAFAARKGWAPSTVCLRAVGNGHLYRRLEAGGDCSTTVAGKLRAFMAENEPEGAAA